MANEFVARRGIIVSTNGAQITGSLLVSGSINATGYTVTAQSFTGSILANNGVVSGAAQVQALLPNGTFSSSAQYPGLVTSSTQIDYNSIQNKLSGVVSSSAQVQPLLPAGTVSSSTQVTANLPGGTVSSSTQFRTLTDPFTGSFTGSFTGDGSNLTGIATVLAFSGSTSGTDTLNLKTEALVFSGSNGMLATVTNNTVTIAAPAGNISASSQVDYNNIQNKLSGVVSSSTQVQPLLPAGTVSSSAQYPGWVTASSQIDYNSITNKLSGVYSSSAFTSPSQGTARLTLNGVALSDVDLGVQTTDQVTFAGVTSSLFGTASLAQNVLTPNVVSSSAQVTAFLPGGTVSSSTATSPSQGTVRITINGVNTDIDTGLQAADSPSFTSITTTATSSIAAVYSSSAQVLTAISNQNIFPSAVSSSGGISGSFLQITNNGTIGGNLTVNGLLTAVSTSIQYVTSSQISIADNKILIGVNDLVRFGGISIVDSGSASPTTASIYWDSLEHRFIYENISGSNYNSAIFIAGPKNTGTLGSEAAILDNRIPVGFAGDHIDNRPASSSIRVDFPSRLTHVEAGLFITGALTANGTVTLQDIPSSSAQIKVLLPADTVTSSTQVKAFLPGGTVTSSAQYPGWVTASSQIDFGQVVNKNGVVSSSTQFKTLTDPFTGSFTGSFKGDGSQLTNIGAAALPPGTVSSSAQYPGWVTSSTQIVWSSVNYNTGIVSSSAQVQPLLPGGTVSSSGQVSITATTGYSTFSSSIATKNDLQDVSINALNAATSSYAINSTIQSQLAGVVSSSAQVKPLLPDGTVTSSAQYPGWVTASSQVLLNSVTGTTFSNASFLFPQDLVVAGNLTAQQFYTEFVSASVIYESGSTKFGDSSDDVMSVTGSIRVLGGNISGSFIGLVSQSAQIDYNNIQNKLSGVVSSSAQVQPLLPNGTVSSSAQYPGWVTSSAQINFTQIQNIAGIVSSSTQFKTLTDPFTGSFTGSFTGDGSNLTGIATVLAFSGSTSGTDTLNLKTEALVFSGSNGMTATVTNNTVTIAAPAGNISASSQVDYNNIQNKLSGVVSSSAQVQPLLPNGTVSSSAQYPGWVTASSQIDYNSIQNKLSGVVSSSTQVQPLLPGGTVSSSAQYPGWITASSQVLLNSVTGTTFSNASFLFPQNLVVAGTLVAQEFYTEYVSGSVIYESGSTKFGDSADDVMSVTGSIRVLGGNISGSFVGLVSQSAQIDYNNIQNKLSGVVSSSAQVQPLLPAGTVSSSAQYPGWITSSTQVVWSSVNYNSGIVSSSTQVQPLLPAGTISSSTQFKTITDPFTGSFTGSFAGTHTGTFPYNSLTGIPSGIVSSSTQVQPLLPGGTVSSSAQYPGWVTSSTQIDYNSIQNKLSGVISSSTQFNALSGTSASFATTASAATSITFTPVTASYAITASYAANAGGLAGVVSSSTQFKTLTDPFTGSFTGSFKGDGSQLTGLNLLSSSVVIDTHTFVGNGVTTNYTLPKVYEASSLIVSVEGLTQTITTDYTLTSTTLSFVSAPPSESNILVRGFVNVVNNATGSFSGSFQGVVTSASYALTASYAANAGGLAGVISSSTQFKTLTDPFTGSFTGSFTGTFPYASLTGIPSGIVSSSAQYPGWVTASSQIQLNAITGTTFSNASFLFPQNLKVEGTLTAQEFYTEFVSASVIYESGSTKFGNSADDVMSVTGSIQVLGGISATTTVSASTNAFINNTIYSGSIVTGIVGPVTNQVVATIPAASCDGVFFDYVVKDGTNYRTGTVMVVSNGTTAEFTDTSTSDIGNTAQAIFNVDIVGGIIRLKFTNTSGTWTVKTTVRAL